MTNHENHERPEDGVGYAHVEQLAEGDDEDGVWRVRVVPVGEGDITHGQSGEPTLWEREPLEAAVENGAFDGAKLLKGRPDDGHKDLLDQADPDEIIGGVDEWNYEPGVGPVGEGKVLDEHLAKLIEHDLVDVSPDMFRLLGEYDSEREVNTVDEIIDVPYITVLDYGASESSTIEPQMAEALGLHPDQRAPDVSGEQAETQEQLAETVTISVPDWDGISESSWERPTLNGTFDGDIDAARNSATVIRDGGDTMGDQSLWVVDGEGQLNINALESAWTFAPQTNDVDDATAQELRLMYERIAQQVMEENEDVEIEFLDEEQLSGLFTLRFHSYGEMIGDEFIDDAVENLEAIEGITAARSSDNDDPELIAVIDRDAVESLDSLNDDIISALMDTPFEVHEDYDWVQEVAWEGLAASAAERSPDGNGSDDGTGQPSDEPAESGVGSTPTTDPTMGNNENELQEQLAEIKAERNQLEEQTDDLEEQLAAKDETIEEKAEQIEQLQGDLEDLKEDVEPLTEMLAGLVAEDSMLNPDQVADRFEVGEMVEALAENTEADEDATPVELVREQLAESPDARGEGVDEETPEQLSPDEEQAANARAREVMGANDVVQASEEQLSPREYATKHFGADPAKFDSTDAFQRAIEAEAGGD